MASFLITYLWYQQWRHDFDFQESEFDCPEQKNYENINFTNFWKVNGTENQLKCSKFDNFSHNHKP